MIKRVSVLGLVLTLTALTALAADRLPSYQGDAQATSVAGLSSGAYMAVQYEVAYSASVKGAGIVAGGPYYCAAGSIFNAARCMGQLDGEAPQPALMLAAAKTFAASGEIDDLAHIKTHRVYVYTGTLDQIVKASAAGALVSFYRLLGVTAPALLYVNTVPSGHAMITADYGNDCWSSAAPEIDHCTLDGVGYDQAGAILQQLYGALNPPSVQSSGTLINFDQREFGARAASMADDGYVFVPSSCAAAARCRLLIVFHGCGQSAQAVGDKFYAHAGFNRWADSNQMLVLYPQVDATLLNPQGCWDWFGYTGDRYAVKSGPQLSSVKAMADRLLGAH